MQICVDIKPDGYLWNYLDNRTQQVPTNGAPIPIEETPAGISLKIGKGHPIFQIFTPKYVNSYDKIRYQKPVVVLPTEGVTAPPTILSMDSRPKLPL